jgi:type II secretory ATPase GspE/PulE/Tfp pilus assembly ATPase PilB-like protein
MEALNSQPENGAGHHNGNRSSALPRLAVSPEAAGVLPAEFVKRHRVLPLKMSGGAILIATAEPGNQRVIDDIRLLTGLEVEEQTVDPAELLEKIAESCQVTVEQMIENLDPAASSSVAEKSAHDIEVMANEPTVVNLVNVIISTALRERASDIHLVPFEEALQLRYRIDGLLQEKPPPPKQLMPRWFHA